MRVCCYRYLLLVWMLLGVGCEPPQQRQQRAYSDIEGITLADLQGVQQPSFESLLNFSILTYVLDADSLELLQSVMDSLSQQQIRYANARGFEANGFSAGLGQHEQGATIAQKLHSIGAVRISQSTLMIPTNTNEILYGTDVSGPRSIIYSTSTTGYGGATIGTGKAGWIMFGQQENAESVQVTLRPAFWEIGGRELRLRAGQEPYEFRFFDVGRFSVSMEAGQICVLGPEHIEKEQNTLNRILFADPPKNRALIFVIIFRGTAGN